MAKHRLLEGLGAGAGSVLKATHEPSTLNELLALERALGAQIEAIGERCVSLWGKGS